MTVAATHKKPVEARKKRKTGSSSESQRLSGSDAEDTQGGDDTPLAWPAKSSKKAKPLTIPALNVTERPKRAITVRHPWSETPAPQKDAAATAAAKPTATAPSKPTSEPVPTPKAGPQPVGTL
jgi:hypothetical protein